MAKMKRLVLDVLKPRQPNIIEFAKAIAALGSEYRVNMRVEEVDDKTESVLLSVEAEDMDFVALEAKINELGASLHSIDEVEILGEAESLPAEP
ncbi:MAG: DUF211 domain-containing protein [Gammaproteobacteria bacterium]|nr:DUF211 domain-containing protein [Gammaproteobacteria bacterium]MCW8839585.1 DUF211 domain-containing protein [Gammaproteobacteria bacterium]MCW8928338.1 DUF211 domain-containing protein [Gammaproteobacteria bacterium]MCW8957441.1 DUF211 domain-containing protein [Gammaproteobacteria bacterium]MCW8972650.1 DUF211 domain-containing protein [Gammaproteobacteria bacterium]